MDTSSLSLRPQTQWSCPSSDSEFYSVSSPETVSPVPSTDLNRSPNPHFLTHASTDVKGAGPEPGNAPSSSSGSGPGSQSRRMRRSRLKNPSEQRQNASEKEKLRMRDLTKALHHLRTYLPPSVAPVGQTLTKIETLRLTIRYISYLSAQLGLTEEFLAQRRLREDAREKAPQILGYFRCRSAEWELGRDRCEAGQYQSDSFSQYPDQREAESVYDTSLVEAVTDPICAADMTQQCVQLLPSCQVYGYQLVPHAFWS